VLPRPPTCSCFWERERRGGRKVWKGGVKGTGYVKRKGKGKGKKGKGTEGKRRKEGKGRRNRERKGDEVVQNVVAPDHYGLRGGSFHLL